MDKATLKLRLGAFRTHGQDADDPLLAEARREVERDPEMAAWFAEEQRFDALMVEKFRGVSAPAGLKEAILLNAKTPRIVPERGSARPASWQRSARVSLALAAGLTLAFFLGRLTLPPNPRPPGPGPLAPESAGGSLALRAIAYTEQMPALEFVCFDASQVASWVARKSADLQMGQVIDKRVPDMRMIGSSVARWEGKPVIMIALQNGEHMAMLYLLRASDFPGPSGADEQGVNGILEKDGWVSKTGRRGDHVYVLTAKGTRQDLNFPMPL